MSRPARPTPVRLGGFLAGLLLVLVHAPAVSSAPVTTLSNGAVVSASGTTTTFIFSVDFSGAAGERKSFETVGGTPPLSASQCVATVGFAQDTGF